jgi:hypothetical protein
MNEGSGSDSTEQSFRTEKRFPSSKKGLSAHQAPGQVSLCNGVYETILKKRFIVLRTGRRLLPQSSRLVYYSSSGRVDCILQPQE